MSSEDYMNGLMQEYRREKGKHRVTAHEVAQWAVANNRYQWTPDNSYVVSKCTMELSRAQRKATYIDPQGREVRLNRCVIESGDQTKMAFWDSMKSASPDFIEKSFQQERMGILARCRKLNTSFDSYKDNINPDTQMEMVFDFTDDLAELAVVDLSA